MKALLYVRVSSKEQTEGYSLNVPLLWPLKRPFKLTNRWLYATFRRMNLKNFPKM